MKKPMATRNTKLEEKVTENIGTVFLAGVAVIVITGLFFCFTALYELGPMQCIQ